MLIVGKLTGLATAIEISPEFTKDSTIYKFLEMNGRKQEKFLQHLTSIRGIVLMPVVSTV